MATLTRLASTLTAKYYPSQNLTDAFYIDGRLFGKRETRQADITIDKVERGFFLSVFAHPSLPTYEPGMMPPYEPQLRNTCNEVKFGRKEIDGMIEGFLSTAVDVTGKMKLADDEERTPYFSGVIVRDAEAFAVTIGSGLAFLYRDDTLFPLTDAGIPMEPIDTNGNRVADFLYYCSSKTANAMWSNFFTLSPDDCIILCNKDVYDALGQREILRILADADDQCDAAGIIITQASARMPNVPMQFSISFVESVTSDEKKGLFGFKRKNKVEEDTSDMSIESTFEGGVVGAAAEAAADAGFVSGLQMTDAPESESTSILFGDNIPGAVAPNANQVASSDKGIELDSEVKTDKPSLEFLDTSVNTEPVVEMTPDEMFKNLFGDMPTIGKKDSEPVVDVAADIAVAGVVTGAAIEAATEAAEVDAASKIAATAVNPFDIPATEEIKMEPISTTEVKIEESDDEKTKASMGFDMDFLKSLEYSLKKDKETPAEEVKEEPKDSEDIIKSAVEEIEEISAKDDDADKVEEVKPDDSGDIVFKADSGFIDMTPVENNSSEVADFGAAFDPYSVGDSTEMQNAAPFVFGDDLNAAEAVKEDKDMDENKEVPVPEFVPEFDMTSEKPALAEEDKLAIDFPKADEVVETKEEPKSEDDGFQLPFENKVDTFEDDPQKTAGNNDIPDMPVYESNTFDTPVNAVSSEESINAVNDNAYTYGQYVENENMAEETVTPISPVEDVISQMPYQPVSNEGQVYAEEADSYQYQPGQFQGEEQYVQPAEYAEAPVADSQSSDDDWINALLGIGSDDSSVDYSNKAVADSYTSAPVSSAPAQPRKTQSAPSSSTPYRTNSQGQPIRSGNGGNGGRGNTKKFMKLNRNGYMFIAFVLICLICLIVLISAIVKSCGRNDDVAEDPTDVSSETEISTVLTESTTAAADPSAPIGMFTFSDYIGYRTWWDLFNQVYGIDDLANESDSRIAIIVTYNGLDPATYTPHSGDSLLLPPVGVLDGSIPVTFQVGGGTTETTAADITVVDGAEGEAEADEATEGGEAAEA